MLHFREEATDHDRGGARRSPRARGAEREGFESRAYPSLRSREASAPSSNPRGPALGDGGRGLGCRAGRHRRGRLRGQDTGSAVIYVDSSFWIALRLPRDERHEQAVQLLERYGDSNLVTSNHIRGETWTFLRRRAGHRSAVHFLELLSASPRVRVEPVPARLEEDAL